MYQKIRAEVEARYGAVYSEIIRGVFHFYSETTGALVATYSEKKGLTLR